VRLEGADRELAHTATITPRTTPLTPYPGTGRMFGGMHMTELTDSTFDEFVSALLDSRSDTLCQKWPEHNDPMPLGFRAPFVICVLPRALCGD